MGKTKTKSKGKKRKAENYDEADFDEYDPSFDPDEATDNKASTSAEAVPAAASRTVITSNQQFFLYQTISRPL